MKNLIKLLTINVVFVFLSCSDEDILQDKKEHMAKDLYERITSMILSSTGNSTPSAEWNNIEKRILDNKDTLFFIENPDFKIMITMRHNMVLDSIKTIQDSVEEKKSEHKGW